MSCKRIVVFVGPPGSGKGSLANLCVQKLGWTQLSTGNLCRKHIAEQTSIGKEIDFAIKSGNLVSDNLITNMVTEWLAQEYENMGTIILDGFPRTVEQARSLDAFLRENYQALQLNIVKLNISDARIIERLSGRVICQNKDCQAVYSLAEGSLLHPKEDMICDLCGSSLGRRKDDEITTVRDRLAVYRKHEHDLLHYYEQKKQTILSLAAEKPLAEVFENFIKMIGLEVT